MQQIEGPGDTAFVSADTPRALRWHMDAAIGAHAAAMDYLNPEQQVFIYQQIRNWVFSRYAVFRAVNLVWSAHGAQAYFWD